MASTEDLFQAPQGSAEGETAAAAQAPATDSAAAPAPARKRAPRRATKKAAAPAPSQSAESRSTDEKPADEAPATDQPVDQPVDQPADDKPADESSADDKPAKPARKRAAKKTARKSAKKAAPEVEGTVEATAEAVEATVEPAGAEVAPLGEALDEGAEQREESDAREAAAGASAVPSLGVLFKAPETPVVPSRRRARKAQPEVEEPQGGEASADEGEQAEQPAEEEATEGGRGRRRRNRGGKGRRGRGAAEGEESAEPDTLLQAPEAGQEAPAEEAEAGGEGAEEGAEGEGGTSRRRTRRRRRSGNAAEGEAEPGVVTKVREPRKERDEPTSLKGSTRLEAKKQRRREGREAGRRRTIITEAEFLARRESVERTMVVRERDGRTQIGVLEDDVLVEHYVSRETNVSMAGNVYLGRVQNVLPSMEAAFVDIGKGRNAVLYAGEVNWDAAGLEANQPKRIENALKSGDTVLVQVTKDPIGHKGARLTSQISLPGRYLVYVPEGNMTGISRKLPDTERARLKQILKEVVPESAGVIVRTAAEGASEEELRADVERLTKTWERIKSKADAKSGSKGKSGGAPALVHGEPDLTVRVIRDVFNEDFTSLVVAGDQAWQEVSEYLGDVAPDLAGRLKKWTSEEDLFSHYRVDEQIAKAMDRKVWLPSGGSLVIDRTEAMTVIDVNTGKFVGSGGNLEETVTKNNIEAAEEIVRQLRLRDIGGIIVIDFIDMVLESNRDLVVRRLLECLGRDRTKHQVAEVTSLGLVQMTRKRVGSGLIEVFSETCDHCNGRGIIVHAEPVERAVGGGESAGNGGGAARSRSRKGRSGGREAEEQQAPPTPTGPTPAQIAAAAHAAALKSAGVALEADGSEAPSQDQPVLEVHETESEEQQPAPARAQSAPERAPATEAAPERAPATEAAPAAAAPVHEAPAAQPAAPEPAAPRRRKRGRVVAPAGPPRASVASPAGEEDGAAPAPDA
ncbi:Rne/Rng family ribonuclease [Knoellia sp. p5-6-4]|uniref:Rne/Rng family ribonuclease n=1 Tax=unclassified Knoellia TaxID=2618719 RepID=UPI0023DAFA4A|nr:Rne/Rng family ribonuclease [Knoellia sp. p5-6-4]MDF2143893.1 Rne/Rng family ribonuclease [Knoellia sp. p5-6-4]